MTMIKKNENGFTLIEILIAMAIAGLVMTGIIRVYSQQVTVNNTQTIIRDMQQNIRAAMYYMEREIRMAGLDPSGDADAGIEFAQTAEIRVSADTGGPGATPGDPNAFFNDAVEDNERVTYRLEPDVDRDGICDNLPANTIPCDLWRIQGDPTLVPPNGGVIAQNIDAIDFLYVGDDRDPVTDCVTDCILGSAVPDNNLNNIRSVQITIVARAGGQNLPGFISPMDDNRIFRGQDGQIVLGGAFTNDGFRRNRLTCEVSLRNMGF